MFRKAMMLLAVSMLTMPAMALDECTQDNGPIAPEPVVGAGGRSCSPENVEGLIGTTQNVYLFQRVHADSFIVRGSAKVQSVQAEHSMMALGSAEPLIKIRVDGTFIVYSLRRTGQTEFQVLAQSSPTGAFSTSPAAVVAILGTNNGSGSASYVQGPAGESLELSFELSWQLVSADRAKITVRLANELVLEHLTSTLLARPVRIGRVGGLSSNPNDLKFRISKFF